MIRLMPVKKNRNRFGNKKNTFKTKKTIHPAVKKTVAFLARGLIILLAVGVLGYGLWQGALWLIATAYKPGAALFSACASNLTPIKAAPMYGMIIDTDGDTIQDIVLTAPDPSTGGMHTIKIAGTEWTMVFFSANFTYTQVSEFLRLSKLEKGNIDYCYLLEQISLTTGAPMEYIIVNDAKKGISASIPLREVQRILSAVQAGQQVTYNETLLPVYNLDDGTKVSVITYAASKEQFPDFFKIDEVAQEQAFVEVYNATDTDGYANLIARKWTMLGIDVSRVGNAAFENPGNYIAAIYVTDPTQYPKTLAMIRSSLPPGPVLVKTGRPDKVVTTGDIVVFLLTR